MAVRAINRPGSQLLGANGRDDGPVVSVWLHTSRSVPIYFVDCHILYLFHVLTIFMNCYTWAPILVFYIFYSPLFYFTIGDEHAYIFNWFWFGVIRSHHVPKMELIRFP